MDMEPKMSELVRAFNEARLCAIHIDLQNVYYGDCLEAIYRANTFAENLQEFTVSNFWVAQTNTYAIRTLLDFKRLCSNARYAEEEDEFRGGGSSGNQLREDLCAKENDIVFTKYLDVYGQGNGLAGDYLKSKDLTTHLYTGIVYSACFYYSVRGALREGFYVYACIDATDCPDDEKEDFMYSLRLTAKDLEASDNLCITSTDDVINALRLS